MSIGSEEGAWRRDFAEHTGNRLGRLEIALGNSSHAVGQLHSLVEQVRLTGEASTQKLAEGMNKALADQQGGVLQIQSQNDLRHAETVQKLQVLLQEGEKKQREEALKLQEFFSAGEQRRQTQLEAGFTQISQVAAGLREQNLLFQEQTQQALENVSRKILEVGNLAREASTRVPVLNAEHLAHMPDPAAHAAALASMAEALHGLDHRLDQRFGSWEQNFRDLSASSTQLSQTLGDMQLRLVAVEARSAQADRTPTLAQAVQHLEEKIVSLEEHISQVPPVPPPTPIPTPVDSQARRQILNVVEAVNDLGKWVAEIAEKVDEVGFSLSQEPPTQFPPAQRAPSTSIFSTFGANPPPTRDTASRTTTQGHSADQGGGSRPEPGRAGYNAPPAAAWEGQQAAAHADARTHAAPCSFPPVPPGAPVSVRGGGLVVPNHPLPSPVLQQGGGSVYPNHPPTSTPSTLPRGEIPRGRGPAGQASGVHVAQRQDVAPPRPGNFFPRKTGNRNAHRSFFPRTPFPRISPTPPRVKASRTRLRPAKPRVGRHRGFRRKGGTTIPDQRIWERTWRICSSDSGRKYTARQHRPRHRGTHRHFREGTHKDHSEAGKRKRKKFRFFCPSPVPSPELTPCRWWQEAEPKGTQAESPEFQQHR